MIPKKNIYLLSNFNLQTINSYLDYFLRKKSFFANIKNGPFDQIDQEIMKINENVNMYCKISRFKNRNNLLKHIP